MQRDRGGRRDRVVGRPPSTPDPGRDRGHRARQGVHVSRGRRACPPRRPGRGRARPRRRSPRPGSRAPAPRGSPPACPRSSTRGRARPRRPRTEPSRRRGPRPSRGPRSAAFPRAPPPRPASGPSPTSQRRSAGFDARARAKASTSRSGSFAATWRPSQSRTVSPARAWRARVAATTSGAARARNAATSIRGGITTTRAASKIACRVTRSSRCRGERQTAHDVSGASRRSANLAARAGEAAGVEVVAVERVDDGGHAGPPRRDPAERPRLRGVRVDDVGALGREERADPPQRPRVGEGADAAPRGPARGRRGRPRARGRPCRRPRRRGTSPASTGPSMPSRASPGTRASSCRSGPPRFSRVITANDAPRSAREATRTTSWKAVTARVTSASSTS